jgi:hypothetical protein
LDGLLAHIRSPQELGWLICHHLNLNRDGRNKSALLEARIRRIF